MTTQNPTPEQLEADIAAQRERLADTVDQLSQKLDVKAQARERLSRLGPQHIAAGIGAAALLGALLWWKRH